MLHLYCLIFIQQKCSSSFECHTNEGVKLQYFLRRISFLGQPRTGSTAGFGRVSSPQHAPPATLFWPKVTRVCPFGAVALKT